MSTDVFQNLSSDIYPLTLEQRQTLGRGTEAGCNMVILAVPGTVNGELLRVAGTRLHERHDVLQLSFSDVPGYRALRQMIADDAPTVDWHVVAVDEEMAQTDFIAVWDQERALDDSHRNRTLHGSVDGRAFQHKDTWHLALSVSRMAMDESSLIRFAQELLEEYVQLLYPAARAEAVPEDSDAPLQYLEYAEWQANPEDAPEREQGIAYWTNYLDGHSEVPSLRLPYSGKAISEDGREIKEARTVRRNMQLDALSRTLLWADENNIDRELLFQAAWWAVLMKVGGYASACAALTYDCRREIEALRGSLGVFGRILPLRIEVDPQMPFVDFVRALEVRLTEHRQWADWSPDNPDVLSRYRPAGFSYVEGIVLSDNVRQLVPAHVTYLGGGRMNVEAHLRVTSGGDGGATEFAIEYNPAVYPEACIEVLLEQYLTLVEAIPDYGKTSVDDVPLISPTERERLLAWRGKSQSLTDETILSRIAEWARTKPKERALWAEDLTLDYESLAVVIDRLTRKLGAARIAANDTVAVLMPRSGSLVAALLSVMNAGAAYLPLDPAWPEPRIRAIIESARPRVILCSSRELAEQARRISVDVEFVDVGAILSEESTGQGFGGALADIKGEQAAYVIYTSGSTGVPKGVVIEHRHLLNYVAAVSEAFTLSECQSFALTSTVAADLGNTVLFGALYNGACLVIASASDMNSPVSFAGFLSKHAIDCLKIVPSHLDALLDSGCNVPLPDVVVLGGESVPPGLIRKLRSISDTSRLYNHYGPTETTVGVLVHPIGASDDLAGVPLTQPLANCRAYLLDKKRRLVPTGACGEFYIGGAQVCRGYLGEPMTDAFIDDPFLSEERLYRTGDVGRYLPEGGVLLMGRSDEQLKIRGFRIEPREIEAACLTLPGVRQAVVRAVDSQLVAYVVRDNTGATNEELREVLGTMLPAAMLPAFLVSLPLIPRLENGKVDRQSLPDPRTSAIAHAILEPQTGVEAVLVQIVAGLLQKDDVGLDDNFFRLGGDSLLVIRFVSRILEKLGVEVLPGVIFANPTVADLSRALVESAVSPEALERRAQLRLRLDAMTPAERAELLARARRAADATPTAHG